jgi:hypothetical protein
MIPVHAGSRPPGLDQERACRQDPGLIAIAGNVLLVDDPMIRLVTIASPRPIPSGMLGPQARSGAGRH